MPDWKSVVGWWDGRKSGPPFPDKLKEACRRFHESCKEGWPILLFLVSLSFVLNEVPWFHHFEYALLDSFVRGQNQVESQDITVVEINKTDHDPMFANCPGCPLIPAKVIILIKAVRRAGAEVIGVDIDTCDDPGSCDQNRSDAGWASPNLKIEKDIDDHTIWAEVPFESQSSSCLKLNLILGQRGAGCQVSGIVRFEQEDGIVRGQQAQYQVCGDTDSGSDFPSFHAAVVAKYRQTNACAQDGGLKFLRGLGPETERVYLNFKTKNLRREQASNFVQISFPTGLEEKPTDELPHLHGIVLIGGAYDASDNYLTPIGVRMPGVELLAEAVQTDLNGSIIPTEWWPLKIGELSLDALAGLFIMFLYSLWNRPGAFVLSLFGMAVVLVSAGFVLYEVKIWVNPIVVMAGMLAHQEYEAARRHEEKPLPSDMLLAEAAEHETHKPD
jgi:CHASE2 domain-containing sensor protein